MNLINKKQPAYRFLDPPEASENFLSPIDGFQNYPLVSIDAATSTLTSIVPDFERLIWLVRQRCVDLSDRLSPDESAAIVIYTYPATSSGDPFYAILNQAIRDADRSRLQPWFSYLKLFITALLKLPSEPGFLYRGVKAKIFADYPVGKKFVWHPFSSCTSSIKALEHELFLGKAGDRTLFDIECYTGKNIRRYSEIPNEEEVLLLPARQFQVMSRVDRGNGLYIIKIKEINSEHSLLEPGVIHKHLHYQNDKLEQLLHKSQSRKLNLNGQVLNDQDVDLVVEQGIKGKKCSKLDLSNIEITQIGISKLADALRDDVFLEELDFSHSGIGDSGVRLLTTTMNSSVLKQIDLSANDISDVGANLYSGNARIKQLSCFIYR